MVAILILVLAGLICVASAMLFLYFTLKYKSEEFVVGFLFAVLLCVGGSIWCTVEAVKRADIYDKTNK